MSALFIKLLNMSITAGWLVLAVLLLRLLLRNAPKWIRGILWAMVAVRLLCPYSFESKTSLIPSTETVQVVSAPASPAVTQITVQSGFEPIDHAINPVIRPAAMPVTPAVQATPAPQVTPDAPGDPMQVIAYIWLAGVAAMLLYAFVSYALLRRKVGASLHMGGRIYCCDDISTPFILGIIRPKIYLPSKLDDQTRQYVLSHEQTHIRRLDHWWKPLGFLLLALYWFHPLIWVGYIFLCKDIELACDEKAIRSLDSDLRADYSQALLSCSVRRKAVSACPLAFGETGVKDRIKNVLHYKKPTLWIILAAALVCTAAAVFLLTDPKTEKPKSVQHSAAGETTPADDPVTPETSPVYISNSYYTPETLPFPLPDFELKRTTQPMVYRNVTPEAMEQYCKKLEAAGFALSKDSNPYDPVCYSFYRSDCIIEIVHFPNNSHSNVHMRYYIQRPALPANAYTPQEALKLILQHHAFSGSSLDADTKLFLPLDITPEGLFERTGGQIFTLEIPYPNIPLLSHTFYITPEGTMYVLTYSSIGVTDADGNGIDETWMIQSGGTSGLFTFTLAALENGQMKYQDIFLMNHLDLSFSEKEGRLCLHGVSQTDTAEAYDFDIAFIDGNIVVTEPTGKWDIEPY